MQWLSHSTRLLFTQNTHKFWESWKSKYQDFVMTTISLFYLTVPVWILKGRSKALRQDCAFQTQSEPSKMSEFKHPFCRIQNAFLKVLCWIHKILLSSKALLNSMTRCSILLSMEQPHSLVCSYFHLLFLKRASSHSGQPCMLASFLLTLY